ncbi:chemotaxis protein CheW [Sphingomonas morindae]|uniref:Chemotaxis protein CheW n=1 Tax=Sphingomonas morindae TaxID=1541170 RepID=A0ABY4X851_9SPHN|nr:chemotaxis protein CheW [Sphingomonas morindae]USI73102.1 chemotaxis protein CheW [Sphingomonas morindae]
MKELKLIARIAGQRVALPTDAIESVVEIDMISPVPLAPVHIAGLAALRSRVLTMIDSYAALGIEAPLVETERQAVVVTVDGHLYGLLVDEVDDVITATGEPAPLHGGLDPGWAAAAIGVVEHEQASLLLLDPARLVAGTRRAAAA